MLFLPPYTGTFMPPSNKPDIDDTQFTYGSKSNNCVETNSVSNDFVSCDNSEKSSDSESAGFASCASSVNSSSTMTNASSSVDLKNFHKTDDQGPSNDTQSPSFSFKENVKTPRNLCNRNGSNNVVYCKKLDHSNRPTPVPAGRPFPAGRSFPAGSRNRPTPVPAERPFPVGRPFPTGQSTYNKDIGIVDSGLFPAGMTDFQLNFENVYYVEGTSELQSGLWCHKTVIQEQNSVLLSLSAFVLTLSSNT
ncbi:hypothetical protein Tco_1079044 [Tanacetum coccineum]|uniref:Uncharacterized protein n=1 Tax=Tanacetum coccineum TaxID=301880 RepID=A0ABQ5HRL5_9ASTR